MSKKWSKPPILEVIQKLQTIVLEMRRAELENKLEQSIKLINQQGKRCGR